MRKWREPDDNHEGYAIWYGPGNAPEQATEVESYHGGWIVSEYQHLGGYVADDDPHADDFLKISTFVSYGDVADAINIDRDEIVFAEDQDQYIRYAVKVGVDRISERGGEESYVKEL